VKAVRVVVTGKVQGVGFRNYVCMRAPSFGVVGRVWNRADGAVEMEAQSENAQVLNEFTKSLWAGPGRVDGVEVVEIPANGEWADFVIVR
jgi:acylphosphatase